MTSHRPWMQDTARQIPFGVIFDKSPAAATQLDAFLQDMAGETWDSLLWTAADFRTNESVAYLAAWRDPRFHGGRTLLVKSREDCQRTLLPTLWGMHLDAASPLLPTNYLMVAPKDRDVLETADRQLRRSVALGERPEPEGEALRLTPESLIDGLTPELSAADAFIREGLQRMLSQERGPLSSLIVLEQGTMAGRIANTLKDLVPADGIAFIDRWLAGGKKWLAMALHGHDRGLGEADDHDELLSLISSLSPVFKESISSAEVMTIADTVSQMQWLGIQGEKAIGHAALQRAESTGVTNLAQPDPGLEWTEQAAQALEVAAQARLPYTASECNTLRTWAGLLRRIPLYKLPFNAEWAVGALQQACPRPKDQVQFRESAFAIQFECIDREGRIGTEETRAAPQRMALVLDLRDKKLHYAFNPGALPWMPPESRHTANGILVIPIDHNPFHGEKTGYYHPSWAMSGFAMMIWPSDPLLFQAKPYPETGGHQFGLGGASPLPIFEYALQALGQPGISPLQVMTNDTMTETVAALQLSVTAPDRFKAESAATAGHGPVWRIL